MYRLCLFEISITLLLVWLHLLGRPPLSFLRPNYAPNKLGHTMCCPCLKAKELILVPNGYTRRWSEKQSEYAHSTWWNLLASSISLYKKSVFCSLDVMNHTERHTLFGQSLSPLKTFMQGVALNCIKLCEELKEKFQSWFTSHPHTWLIVV